MPVALSNTKNTKKHDEHYEVFEYGLQLFI